MYLNPDLDITAKFSWLQSRAGEGLTVANTQNGRPAPERVEGWSQRDLSPRLMSVWAYRDQGPGYLLPPCFDHPGAPRILVFPGKRSGVRGSPHCLKSSEETAASLNERFANYKIVSGHIT